MSDWLTPGLAHLWLPYTQMQTAPAPLPVVASTGVRLELADGRQLIDGISSWWTACHGYNHPHIRAAVEQQLARLPHVMFAGLVHEPAARLAARLAALLPGDLERVFFTESGSVSVEVALKMAIQYWRNQGQAEKRRIVCFRHGYHGDTFATMALCDPEEGMHTLFAGSMPEQIMAELPTDATLRAPLTCCWKPMASALPPSSSNRWCRVQAACACTMRRRWPSSPRPAGATRCC
jgi:adenosylmethionine-8-amino-7-oxononanoate aminotransferase